MLVVRGTKKLRDRVTGIPAGEPARSTTALGDWFANVLPWEPEVALVVNARTLLPVLVELAPASTLLERIPAEIAHILRLHGADEVFVAAEHAAMTELRIAPTDDRSVVGVMTDFARLAGHVAASTPGGLEGLALRLAATPVSPLCPGPTSPDRALAEVLTSGARARPPRPRVVATSPATAAGEVYQLKVTLQGTKPPVWRRILVDGASTLDHLHEVVQAAFGWCDDHLHEFEADGSVYGMPNPMWADLGRTVIEEHAVRLDAIAVAGSTLSYTYDLGDRWEHRMVVEKVTPAQLGITVPACLGGRRACPPEDCGGPWGYAYLLEVLADPDHPEHDERRAWLGGPFDPDAFDRADVDRRLRTLRGTSHGGG